MTKALASLGGIFCVTLVICLSGVLLSTAPLETTKARTCVDNITGERSIESASDASILPAGWDERGKKMWWDATVSLNRLILSSGNVVEYATAPLGTVKSHTHGEIGGGNFFKSELDGKPRWEFSTFLVYLTFLPGHESYIDFGSWIGPTLFYAAQIAKKSYGIEADPVAFASVSATLVLNGDKYWGKSVTLQPGGVGPGSSDALTPVEVSMKSAKAGNSCSGMGDWVENCGRVGVHWKVNTYTLPALLKHWNVAASDAFIKVDTEAFECKLVPSWIPWLTKLRVKPTFFISFHSYIKGGECSEEEYDAIARFARLFKRAVTLSADEHEFIDASDAFTRKGDTIVFTDRDFP